MLVTPLIAGLLGHKQRTLTRPRIFWLHSSSVMHPKALWIANGVTGHGVLALYWRLSPRVCQVALSILDQFDSVITITGQIELSPSSRGKQMA